MITYKCLLSINCIVYYSEVVHMRHEKRRRKLPELPKNRSNVCFIFYKKHFFSSQKSKFNFH